MASNNNDASIAAMNDRKRKMKEVAVDESPVRQQHHTSNNNIFNLQTRNLFTSPNVGRVQQILNTAGPVPCRPSSSTLKPFSFVSLLTAPEHELVEMSHSMQLDHIITHQSDNLKQVLAGMLDKQRREAEERATKKLKEKEEEIQAKYANKYLYLEQLLEYYKGENESLTQRTRCLERTTMTLRDSLAEANAALDEVEEYDEDDDEDDDDDENEPDHAANEDAEDAESSFEDPDKVNPLMLDCKECHKERATMMIWPCRCLSLCKGCERVAMTCPVCRSVKNIGIEVFVPPQ